MNTKDTLLFAGVGLALYVLWKGKDLIEDAADAVLARPIAYIISKLTLPAAVHINGGAVLPDGGYVSWDAINQAGYKLDSQGIFIWESRRYKVRAPRRSDGNYDAVIA